MAVSVLGNPVRGGGTVESFGVDFGNASSAAQPGWTNMGAVTTTPSTSMKNVPLRRNNLEASSSPVLAGTLFGRPVYLAVKAKSEASVGNMCYNNGNSTWKEKGVMRGAQSGGVLEAESAFNFPNHGEALNTSLMLFTNGVAARSGTVSVSLSGLVPGKEYAVSFFLGNGKPACQSISLAAGNHVEVKALQTSTGSFTDGKWKGGVNTAGADTYMAVEWSAEADGDGALVFDVVKEGSSSATGAMNLNAVTVRTDDTPAPPAPEPRPVSVLHNKALTRLSSPVVLPVPADAWTGTGEMTCELWIRPDEDASSCAILSLGASTLSLNRGRLRLDSGDAETPASVEAAGQPLAAGTWHHVAVSLGAVNVSLYVDGTLAGSAPAAAYLASMKKGWAGLVLSPQFRGARDELRFWNTELGSGADDFFLSGPLPMGHPKYGRLAGLWRLDGDFRDAKWTEFAEKTGSSFTRPYQAVTPAGAEFSIVTDNNTFRYMLVTAYVRDSHLSWNWPERSHIIGNSDLIYIGSASAAANGDITFSLPDNDVTESRGVVLLPSDGARTSVLEFSGDHAYMNVGNGLLAGSNANAFTVEVNMALAAAEQNVTLFENDSASLTLAWVDGHYKARMQAGSTAAWEADLPAVALQEYFWLAFIRNSAAGTGAFYVNGSPVATAAVTPGEMNGTPNAVVGRDLKGKIDEMRVWHLARPVNRLGTAVQPNWNDRSLVARWGNSGVFGRDTASWAEHVRALRRMTEGVSGMRIRLGIAGGAWNAMLTNAAARQRFADGIRDLLKKYPLDGVDLDFEWLYQGDGKWSNYGQLAQAIRETNPDMFFSISLHPVAYWFPAAYMQYVDYFTFQNYGPAIDVNTYNSMVSACGKFRSQGFPDSKIILSAPFQGTPGTSGLPDGKKPGDYIKGYREIAANCPEADNPDNDAAVYSYSGLNLTLHYNGVTTVRKKTKYISDQKLAGFMYWDLGLDVADASGKNNYFDRRSLLRAANRYASSTAFPVTASPFGLSRVGAAVPAEGAAVEVEVQMEEAALGWVVAEKPDWISVSADSGMGRTTVILTAAKNKSAGERSGTVLFRASDKQECAVTVTQAGADLAGYDKWVQDAFPPDSPADQTAPDAAPAGDGVTNLMKYATGLDPLKPCGSVTKLEAEEGADGKRHLVLRWPVNPQAAEVRHEVEISPDLVNWTSLGEVETAGKTSAEFHDAEPVAEGAMNRRFLRLKVTRE